MAIATKPPKTLEEVKAEARERALRYQPKVTPCNYDPTRFFVESSTMALDHQVRTQGGEPCGCTCQGSHTSRHHWCQHQAAVEMHIEEHGMPSPVIPPRELALMDWLNLYA